MAPVIVYLLDDLVAIFSARGSCFTLGMKNLFQFQKPETNSFHIIDAYFYLNSAQLMTTQLLSGLFL